MKVPMGREEYEVRPAREERKVRGYGNHGESASRYRLRKVALCNQPGGRRKQGRLAGEHPEKQAGCHCRVVRDEAAALRRG